MKHFRPWLQAAVIRALRTFAQTMVGVIGASAIWSDVNWQTVLSAGALAAVLSLLTSVAGLPEVEKE
jgi:hypothetical protein